MSPPQDLDGMGRKGACFPRTGPDVMDDPEAQLLREIGRVTTWRSSVWWSDTRVVYSNFLYRYLRDREAAEDLTQEVFLKVYQAASRFERGRK